MRKSFLSTIIYVIVIVTCHKKKQAAKEFVMYVMFLWMTVSTPYQPSGSAEVQCVFFLPDLWVEFWKVNFGR